MASSSVAKMDAEVVASNPAGSYQEPAQKFLQEAATACQEMHFNKAQQLMDWNKSVPAELRKLTNTFLELKDAYLELEAKQGFLEHLAREDVLSMEESQIQNAMETLVESVASGEHKLQQVKAQLTQMRKDVQQMGNIVATKYNAYMAERDDYVTALRVEQENALRQNTVDMAVLLRVASVERGSKGLSELQQKCLGMSNAEELTMDTEARVNAVLQNQVKVIQQMDKHAQELQEKIQEYESTLQPLVETVDKLRQEASTKHSLQQAVSASAPLKDDVTSAKLDKDIAWYQSVKKVVQKLSGVESGASAGKQGLVFNTSHGFSVGVSLDATQTQVQKVEVLASSAGGLKPVTAELHPYLVCDDASQLVGNCRNFCLLLHELQNRFRLYPERCAQLKQFTSKYMVSWTTSTTAIVTLDLGVIVTVFVSPDFPTPAHLQPFTAGSVHIASIESVSGWDKKALSKIQEAINSQSSKTHDLMVLFGELETQLRAVGLKQ